MCKPVSLNMKNLLLILSLFIISCKSDGRIDLDDLRKSNYKFSELPHEVKEHIESDIIEIAKVEYDYHMSTNNKLTFEYDRTGGGKTWMEDINNNYHIFRINGQEYKLKGNLGDPFIIHDSALYYTTELNLFQERYMDAHYIGIDLSEHLKK
jgi:hypothetical protein